MDYNNMNKRASRSAYNYDNDRRISKPVNNKRRENNADFNDFRKKRPAAPNQQVRYNPPRQNTGIPSSKRPLPNQNTRNMSGAPQRQRPNPNQPRPQNPKNRNQSSQSNRNSQRKAPQSQQKRNDWIYPEGYNPNRPPQMRGGQAPQQRRPQNNSHRRPQQKKKSAPAIRIHIDWQRVGAVCSAVFLRFVCCIIAVMLVLSGYYFKNFYTKQQPPVEEMKYIFATVSGEGDDAVTVLNESVSVGALAYDRSELLISFSDVSKWLGSAQVGDIYSMRFVIGSEEESQTVVFHNSSQDAFVNGCPIVMKCRAQFRHGEVWVPVSFIKDYITGIEITEKKDSVSLSLSGEELSFILSPSNPITPVPIPEEEE